jgi:hypothetical protein
MAVSIPRIRRLSSFRGTPTQGHNDHHKPAEDRGAGANGILEKRHGRHGLDDCKANCREEQFRETIHSPSASKAFFLFSCLFFAAIRRQSSHFEYFPCGLA